MKTLKEIKKVYFLGIGGIGMSALAQFFLDKGKQVYGYDRVRAQTCLMLETKGACIHYGEAPEKIPRDIDLVVYTPAISEEHLEWPVLRAATTQINKRSEVLGKITEGFKTIAVAGSHGKTTTASLITHLLWQAGRCNAFLGGISKNLQSNYAQAPESPYMVVEADEFDRSFLQLHPLYSVITSMDADHLDIYGHVENMREAFVAFAELTQKGGKLFVKEDLHTYFENRSEDLTAQTETYQLEDSNSLGFGSAQYYASNIRIENESYVFDFNAPQFSYKNVYMTYPGRHNVENAIVAIAVGHICGLNEQEIRRGLESFKGVQRRFDYKIKRKDFIFIDDYAHHPREIRACLESLREMYAQRKLTVVLQPHLYSRTRDLAAEFAQSLSLADEIILLAIYPARGLPIEGVSSQMIGEKITKPVYYATKENLAELLRKKSLELLVCMGAGDIDSLVEPLQDILNKGRYEKKVD